MGRQQGIFRIIFLAIIVSFVLSSCITIKVDEPAENEGKIVVAQPVTGNAGAAGQQAIPTQAAQPTAAPTVLPAPTATKYIPEGQLFFYNFEDVAVGADYERYPGIRIIKPDFGIQVEVAIDKEYILGAGLSDRPDGNVSVYALNVTPPEETTAMIICRGVSGTRDDGTATLVEGYIGYYRFDGRAKLVKRIGGQDYVLGDWKTGVSVNPQGIFNQLYLYCDGPRILYMVNAEVVYDVTDGDLTSGDYAVGIKNPSDGITTRIHFDKIAVFEP